MTESVVERPVAELRIRAALARLGLAFADAAGLVVFDPEAQTAFWSYGPGTAESIHVGPAVVSMDVPCIEMVLRHELLHRATYHGHHERYSDRALANIVLDACINRLLFDSYPEAMRLLSLAIYEPAAKRTVVALADCTADPARLPAQLAALWHELWHEALAGRGEPPNPSALYYRLLDLARLEGLGIRPHGANPFGGHEAPPSGMPERVRRAVRAASAGAIGTPSSPGDDEVSRFVLGLGLERAADPAGRAPVGRTRQATRDAFPLIPTRAGLVLLATGVSQATGIYRNIRVADRGSRLRVCFYVDRSESMCRRFGAVRATLRALDGVPLGIRLFDDRVARIGDEEFRCGRYGVGGWTSFNAVIDDFLSSPELSAAVVFTDGAADLDPARARRLRESGKRLHGVLFCSAAAARASPLALALDSWMATGEGHAWRQVPSEDRGEGGSCGAAVVASYGLVRFASRPSSDFWEDLTLSKSLRRSCPHSQDNPSLISRSSSSMGSAFIFTSHQILRRAYLRTDVSMRGAHGTDGRLGFSNATISTRT